MLLKIYLDGKQYSLYTAPSRLLVMIQAEIKLFVISFPSVKHVILETLFSHYLILARFWGMSRRLLQCIQDSTYNSMISNSPNFYALGCCNVIGLAVPYNGPQGNRELQSKACILYKD